MHPLWKRLLAHVKPVAFPPGHIAYHSDNDLLMGRAAFPCLGLTTSSGRCTRVLVNGCEPWGEQERKGMSSGPGTWWFVFSNLQDHCVITRVHSSEVRCLPRTNWQVDGRPQKQTLDYWCLSCQGLAQLCICRQLIYNLSSVSSSRNWEWWQCVDHRIFQWGLHNSFRALGTAPGI